MLLQHSLGWNIWHVNGVPVYRVVLHDGKDILLDMESRCIYKDGACNPFVSLDDIAEVATRRKFKIERPEHCLVKDTFYINVSLFGGYGTVDELPHHDSGGLLIHYRWMVQVHMAVDGKPAEWVRLMAPQYHRYEPTPRGEMAQKVQKLFASSVSGHPNEDISLSQAGRILNIIPALQSIVEGK